MSGLVTTQKNAVLDAHLGASATLLPATVYIGLLKADPSDDGSGVVEPTGGSYARVAVSNNGTNWPAAAGGVKSNAGAVSFPTPTADWGECTHVGVFDAASAGNLRMSGPLGAPRNVLNGDNISFGAGELEFEAA